VVATIQTQPVAQTITKLPNVTDVCVNGTVSATFSGGSGGVSPVDLYESSIDGNSTWQPYTSASPISSAVAGTNRLQIRTWRTSAGTGCVNSAYTTMNWNTVVQPSWNTYTFPTTIICAGGLVTFSASVVNGLGGTLTWIRSVTPGGVGTTVTSPDVPPSLGTFYYRPQFVASGQGCNLADGTETMVTVQVDPTWNVITSPVSNICIGGNVIFSATLNNAGAGTVQWVRSATSLGVGTVVTSPDAPGIGIYYYRPKYVAGYGGCNLSDGTETLVTVQVDPTWNVITSPASNICIGGNVTFSATLNNAGAGTVQWIRSATPMGVGTVVTSPDALPAVGTYYYRSQYVTGYGGCNLANGTETLVTVNSNPAPVITGPSDVCPGMSGIIYSTPFIAGHTYVWTIIGATSYSGENSNILTVSWPNTCGIGSVRVTETITATGCSIVTPDFSVSRTDVSPPIWTTAVNLLNRTVQCSDAAGIAAAQALFPVASDNCDADVTNIVKVSGGFVTGTCAEAGTYTNTWTVTDACGNTSAVYTQVITIIDTQAPVWTTAVNLLNRTVQCSDAAGIAAAQALFPVASDNCDADVTNIVKVSGVFIPSGNPREGTYTNTWTVTDNCGNVSATYAQVITIIDNITPVITCPFNITIN
jgi:hypothetical protein